MAINRSKNKRAGIVPPEEFTLRGTAATPLDVVVQIAEERNGYLEKMRAALLTNDDEQLKLYARKLCGLPPESVKQSARARGPK